MNEMIGQLLSLARADSDRPAMTEEIDLSEIVRSVATDTDYEARQTGREVRVGAPIRRSCSAMPRCWRARSKTSFEMRAAIQRGHGC